MRLGEIPKLLYNAGAPDAQKGSPMNRLLPIALSLALLGGCASISNPVNNNTEASAESAYIATAGLETAYLALGWCASGTHFALTAPCKEPAIVHQSKLDENAAYSALLQLRAFQKANPGSTVTISNLAAAVISAAAALRNYLPLKGA